MTLDLVKPGRGGIIAAVGGEGALRRRLLDMGLTPGTFVHVRRVAPMGDPVELVLRGYVLTIRMDDAAKIQLREAAPEPPEAPSGCAARGKSARKADANPADSRFCALAAEKRDGHFGPAKTGAIPGSPRKGWRARRLFRRRETVGGRK